MCEGLERAEEMRGPVGVRFEGLEEYVALELGRALLEEYKLNSGGTGEIGHTSRVLYANCFSMDLRT